MTNLKSFVLAFYFAGFLSHAFAAGPDQIKLTKAVLKDKIKGGWAGQVIGCTFGGPTEFLFRGTMIQDYQPIPWDEERCMWYFENGPGLYDDIYMDLTFVDVFEKEGLDAPATSHANAFARAKYPLWHANQCARYNILRGIMPPASGNWLNNPHADDIDFQIEADFAGLMSPGMVNTASEICDKIGHIMNYGDGWYGGVYVAAMYSLAFVSDDLEYIVTEGLKAIPRESVFYQCISDVIGWWKQYPDEWKKNWFECQKKWSSDVGCPHGVFSDLNIDAKINSAYIIIGLLYGNGDFGKTMEISTRCGQDSDCNPASAGGILGTMLGYSQIPDFWKKPVLPVEDRDFKYTTMSLNDAYRIGYKHALENLITHGAVIKNDVIEIPFREINQVQLEYGFEGHYPVERKAIGKKINAENPEMIFNFIGVGFVLCGGPGVLDHAQNPEYILDMEMSIDGELAENFMLSASYLFKIKEVTWKYQLPDGLHKVRIKWLNPDPGYQVQTTDLIVYGKQKMINEW